MLVLSRQRDETIMIGDAVEITVIEVRGDKVRLGINAPRTVAVHRKEIHEAIQAENSASAASRLDGHDLRRSAAPPTGTTSADRHTAGRLAGLVQAVPPRRSA